VVRQHEGAADIAGGGVGRVHGKERGRGAGGRHEEFAPRQAKPSCMARGFAHCRLVGEPVHRFERDRREFAVGRGIELDREAESVRIVAEDAADMAHGCLLENEQQRVSHTTR
jgi:hypothetical protein